MRVKLLIVGGVLLLAGLVAGFYPLSATSLHVHCGTAFLGASADDEAVQQVAHVSADCADQRSTMRAVALVLLGAGCVSLVGGVAAGSRRESASVS